MENTPAIKIGKNTQTRVVLIHAKGINSLADFYKDIELSLETPPYFGHNLDALDEILADLSWISEPSVVLIIYRSELLLQNNPNERDNLMEVLSSCSNPKLDVLFL